MSETRLFVKYIFHKNLKTQLDFLANRPFEIRRPLLVRGIRLRRSRSSLLFNSCSLAVAVCSLLVVGPGNRPNQPHGLTGTRFPALPRPSKNQQAELQYYLVNNQIQESKLQYYLVNSSIQRS